MHWYLWDVWVIFVLIIIFNTYTHRSSKWGIRFEKYFNEINKIFRMNCIHLERITILKSYITYAKVNFKQDWFMVWYHFPNGSFKKLFKHIVYSQRFEAKLLQTYRRKNYFFLLLIIQDVRAMARSLKFSSSILAYVLLTTLFSINISKLWV